MNWPAKAVACLKGLQVRAEEQVTEAALPGFGKVCDARGKEHA
jgi:hypothetical protein